MTHVFFFEKEGVHDSPGTGGGGIRPEGVRLFLPKFKQTQRNFHTKIEILNPVAQV